MQLMPQAIVFNVQKYSLHDGDGIRTTFFFKGCPLACKWCHNPEGWSPDPQLFVYPNRCKSCGLCGQICPAKRRQDALAGLGAQVVGSAPFESAASTAGSTASTAGSTAPTTVSTAPTAGSTVADGCTACGACVDVCVHGAREVAGRLYTPEELIRIAVRDMAFYQVSGGGVTLSGGEVMAQDRGFLLALARGLKREGIDLAIDTCGYAPFEAFEDLAPYVDVFLYDIKFVNSELHMLYTGRDNRLILENIKRLSDSGARIHARIPVIGGVNDCDSEMAAISRYIAGNVRVERINLLPYHAIGRDKYTRFGMVEEDNAFFTPSNERMEELADRFRRDGHADVRIGG